MKTVYVAGKLNAMAVDYIKNMNNMIWCANTIKSKGYAVYIPCLDFLTGLVIGYYDYEDYADNNMAWLEKADLVYVMAFSEDSIGTQKEKQRASELGIPIITRMEQL